MLVSNTVKDLVAGSGIEFDERGTAELKGVPGEWRLYAVRTKEGGEMGYKMCDAAEVELMHGVFRPIRRELGLTAFGINQEEFPPNADGYPDHDHSGGRTGRGLLRPRRVGEDRR